MDIFAHALWTNAVFYKKYAQQKRNRYLGVLFGILPDIISFAPVQFYFLFNHTVFSPVLFDQPTLWIFRYSVESYNFTHSLVIFALVALVVTALRHGKFYWPLLGWAVHIVIDIFTHTNFFPTPFLFPLSNIHNTFAVQWSNPTFMFINYGALMLVYVFVIEPYRRRLKTK